jgi:hypothetical protein
MSHCSRTLLAETPQCRIERCHCGVLHLTVGPLTFRTTPDVLQSLASAAADALGSLALDALMGGHRHIDAGGPS